MTSPRSRTSHLEQRGADFSATDLLRQILAAQLRTNELLEQLKPRHCGRDDERILSKVMPGLAGCFGSNVFSVREVFADPGLVETLHMDRKRTGNLFRRASDDAIVVDGLMLRKVGSEHRSGLWQLVRCPVQPPNSVAIERKF